MKLIAFYISRILILALPSVLILVGYAYHLNSVSNAQKKSNDLLAAEILLLDRRVEEVKDLKKLKEGLLERYMIISELADKDKEMAIVIAAIANLNAGVFLEFVEMDGDRVTFRGSADDLSSLLQTVKEFELAGVEFTNQDSALQEMINGRFQLKGGVTGNSNEDD